MEQLYTVKDLASMTALTSDDETVAKVMRQIRHWTNHDVLRPFGPKNTGTGVSRVYDAHGARKAAILVELTRYGINVEMLKGFDEWCDGIENTETWEYTTGSSSPFYIGMTWTPEDHGGGLWKVLDEDAFSVMMTGDEDFAMDKNFDPKILHASSMIVINLTPVFARVAH